MTSLVLYFLLIVGMAIYFVRPKMFFFYWLSIQPYILPVFFILFKDSMMPMMDNYLPNLYFRYPYPFCNLILLLFCASYTRKNIEKSRIKVILLPIFLLVIFLTVQNFVIGFRPGSLYANIIYLFGNVAPFLLLLIDERVRPSRNSVIHFIYIFVYVQLFFSLLNLADVRIYTNVTDIFDDNLIQGTFTRYNHMTNYLSIFFFILSYEYYICKRVKAKMFYFMALLIGLLITLSGSRMTFVLFTFVLYFFFCLSHSKKVAFLVSLGAVSLFSMFVLGNDAFSGQKANEGSGFERNLIGVVEVANSDDLSEGSTLELSAFLLIDKFNSPIIGNGKAYRGGENFYGHPTDTLNEDVFKTDARLAYMLVEYGFIGLFLFLLLYAAIFKGCYLFGEEQFQSLYWGAFIYFILFSITDNGFWDIVVISALYIYAFSPKRNKRILSMEINS